MSVLAFDFGINSIGVAVGNEFTMSATPLEAVKARDGIPNADQINALFKEWQPSYIVVGYPINMDGTKEELSFKARKFGNRLADKFKLKVYFKDERLTTADAKERIFSQYGYKGLASKGKIDCVSAALILESFFEEKAVNG